MDLNKKIGELEELLDDANIYISEARLALYQFRERSKPLAAAMKRAKITKKNKQIRMEE